jgi:holin-like protein
VIAGLVQILLFQGLGELVSKLAIPFMPGPVVGLMLMLAWLAIRRKVPESVDVVASTLVQHLGLLFIPAAVGVVMFWPQLKSHAVAVVTALVVSVALTIAVPALVLRFIAPEKPEGQRPDGK